MPTAFLRVAKSTWLELVQREPEITQILVNGCIEVRYVKKYEQYLFWGGIMPGDSNVQYELLAALCNFPATTYRFICQSELDVDPEINAGRLNGRPFFLGIQYKIDYILSGRDVLIRDNGRTRKTIAGLDQ